MPDGAAPEAVLEVYRWDGVRSVLARDADGRLAWRGDPPLAADLARLAAGASDIVALRGVVAALALGLAALPAAPRP